MNMRKGKLITDDNRTIKYYLSHKYNDKEILIETDELIKKKYTKINIYLPYGSEGNGSRKYFYIKSIYRFTNKIYEEANNCDGYLYLVKLGDEVKDYVHLGKYRKKMTIEKMRRELYNCYFDDKDLEKFIMSYPFPESFGKLTGDDLYKVCKTYLDIQSNVCYFEDKETTYAVIRLLNAYYWARK